MMDTFFQDQAVRLMAVFTDAAGNLADPTEVTVNVKDPAGATIAPTLIRDDVGLYHVDVNVTKAGIWRWRWRGTGNVAAVDQGEFAVIAKNV